MLRSEIQWNLPVLNESLERQRFQFAKRNNVNDQSFAVR
jgi:hypothetical protein